MQAANVYRLINSPLHNTTLQIIQRIQIELGDAAFSTLWEQVFNGQPLPDFSSVNQRPYFLNVAIAFILAPSLASARRIIERHPILLSVEVEKLLEEMITFAAQQDPEGYRMVEPKRTLLAHCREKGVAVAFSEIYSAKGNEVGFITTEE